MKTWQFIALGLLIVGVGGLVVYTSRQRGKQLAAAVGDTSSTITIQETIGNPGEGDIV